MKSGERQLGKPERNGYKVGIALYFNVLEQIVFLHMALEFELTEVRACCFSTAVLRKGNRINMFSLRKRSLKTKPRFGNMLGGVP